MNDQRNQYPHKQSQYLERKSLRKNETLSSYREDTGSEKVQTTIPVQDCCTAQWAAVLKQRGGSLPSDKSQAKGQEGSNENPLRTGEKPQPRRWLWTPEMGNWTVQNESGGNPSPSPKAHWQWWQGRPPLETTSRKWPPAGTDGSTGQGQSSYWSPQWLPDPASGRRSLEKVQRL